MPEMMTAIHYASRSFSRLSTGVSKWSFSCRRLQHVSSWRFCTKHFGHFIVRNGASASVSQILQISSKPEERRNVIRQDERNRRIHILGIGNIGRLLAHSLAAVSDRPAIVLMLHRPALVQAWNKGGQTVELVTDGVTIKQEGYEIEAIHDLAGATELGRCQNSRSNGTGDVIDNLIVTTKTIHTISALSAIKRRLTQGSTILFTQNGMGTIDEVNAKLFQDSRTRPKYMTAIVSHGVYSKGPFSSVHAGNGTIHIGRVHQTPPFDARLPAKEREGQDSTLSSLGYLSTLITQVPVLAATVVTPIELMQIQFEKLIVNAMINPLTVVFDCRNGELFSKANILRLVRSLLSEASHVIRSLPELQHVQRIESRFSKERLDELVLRAAEKTSRNFSSMVQDARAGKETEIDYINGYIVEKGEQVGVDCVYNRRLVQMVKDREKITDAEVDDFFPHRRSQFQALSRRKIDCDLG